MISIKSFFDIDQRLLPLSETTVAPAIYQAALSLPSRTFSFCRDRAMGDKCKFCSCFFLTRKVSIKSFFDIDQRLLSFRNYCRASDLPSCPVLAIKNIQFLPGQSNG
jgi:hypothetical protein